MDTITITEFGKIFVKGDFPLHIDLGNIKADMDINSHCQFKADSFDGIAIEFTKWTNKTEIYTKYRDKDIIDILTEWLVERGKWDADNKDKPHWMIGFRPMLVNDSPVGFYVFELNKIISYNLLSWLYKDYRRTYSFRFCWYTVKVT